MLGLFDVVLFVATGSITSLRGKADVWPLICGVLCEAITGVERLRPLIPNAEAGEELLAAADRDNGFGFRPTVGKSIGTKLIGANFGELICHSLSCLTVDLSRSGENYGQHFISEKNHFFFVFDLGLDPSLQNGIKN